MTQFRVGDRVRRTAPNPASTFTSHVVGVEFVVAGVEENGLWLISPDRAQHWHGSVELVSRPDPDQDPEAPPLPSVEDTYRALGLQIGELVAYMPAAVDALNDALHDEARMRRILSLAGERQVEGFVLYNDDMYGKSEQELIEDIDEEIADALNYLTRLLALRASSRTRDGIF